jgi:hypothetical protein
MRKLPNWWSKELGEHFIIRDSSLVPQWRLSCLMCSNEWIYPEGTNPSAAFYLTMANHAASHETKRRKS